jgi:uncharacterized protein YxeA
MCINFKEETPMKKLFVLSIALLLLAIWVDYSAAVKIEGDKKGPVIKIETDMYRVHWKTANQAGYVTAFAKSGKDELRIIEGDAEGRRFYHSANYAGWKDWGSVADFEVVEEGGGKIKVEYTMNDGDSKEYICTVTYWDGSPLVKHQVVVKALKNVVSFADGHEPMYEIRGPSKGMKMWPSEGNAGPFARCAFWTKEGGFSALYATDPLATAESFADWANGLGNGRMHLVHNALGKNLTQGNLSDPIVYWVAFGVGDDKDADALSETVAAIKDGDLEPQAVDAKGKLSTTWGALKKSN